MRQLTWLSLTLIFLLLAGGFYYLYRENEQLKDPGFIYEHYLKTYEGENYSLIAVQYTIKPGFILQGEYHWKIYLYGNHELVELRVDPRNRHAKNYPTILDYSTISAPIESFRELTPPTGEYSTWIYVPKGNELSEYPGGCIKLGEALDNETMKLVNSTFRDTPIKSPGNLELVRTAPTEGVLIFQYYKDCDCSGTWLIVKPHNESRDLVQVIYPWGRVEGYSPVLELEAFNGTHYSKLASKLENKYCAFLGGIIVNSTGIYVNPNAEEAFEKVARGAKRDKRCFLIPTITIYANGTIREGGIGTQWCFWRY
ncbi:hypothetical protein [Thermococcus sp. Bubb.Bath]|uniref:hypothetical protein n=1 Tax=Thermococcus sp. Bubb.Bath TaxID=1638242 RepID=UPI00143C25E9|nr:hypothetical protein [Thermococcus sp. Bubb.Bath]NJF25510.1 hypothetical protein [Thermococcus sp. Bubb.Bath]